MDNREWLRAWVTVAANSFGGPAGQIAVMHDEIVERRGWVDERRFLHALNYCMLLPGPEAQQLATYLGWLVRGVRGGLVAGGLFILPGFVSIMGLSILFAVYGDIAWVAGLFVGIGAAVIAIVAAAVIRIGRRVLTNGVMVAVAVAAFVAIFVFELPFPLVVLTAAAIGAVGGRLRPDIFNLIAEEGGDESTGDATETTEATDEGNAGGRPRLGRSLRVLAVGLVLWFGPTVVLALVLGGDHVFVDVGRFFSGAAVLTFGGAYSVLAYLSAEAVNTFGWLEPGEMVTGLGMAETTPGPTIQVVQFVGFMGPYRDPGSLTPLQAGVAGAVLTTWVTFVPSFLWIFLGAPFVEQLRGRVTLTSALSTVTAAVVGVVLNLAVWFALYTVFETVTIHRRFGAVLYEPDVASIDWLVLAIAIGSAVAVFVYRLPTLRVVLGAAAVGIVSQLLTG